MRLRLLFTTGLLLVSLVLFNSCSKDEAAPKLQFVFDGETISLTGANLYLTTESTFENRANREYFISDGTYTNADDNNGWSLGDYDGATYYLAVELVSGVAGDLTVGEFPSYYNWDLPADNSTISYIYLESGIGNDYFEYDTDYLGEDHSPDVVSGGLEDGDKMTLKFNGTLTYYYFDGTNWVENSVTGKFYYSGTVNDERAPI